MNIRILFHGMKYSDSVEQYTSKALRKFNKFFKEEQDPVYFDLVFETDKHEKHYEIELQLRGKDLRLKAVVEGTDLYREIDHVVKIMIKELRKHKEKALDTRDHPDTPKDSF